LSGTIQCLDRCATEDGLDRLTFSQKTERLKQLVPQASDLIARINAATGERNRIIHTHTTFNVDLKRVRFKYKGQNVPASAAYIDKIANDCQQAFRPDDGAFPNGAGHVFSVSRRVRPKPASAASNPSGPPHVMRLRGRQYEAVYVAAGAGCGSDNNAIYKRVFIPYASPL
jgi:hypothetical protein